MAKNPSQRVGVFVDVQNVYHSAKNLNNARVNFKNLLDGLVDDRHLIRAIGYVVKSDSTLGEESFFEALEKAGFELRVKDLKVFSSGVKKADWDVGMSVDAIRIADDLDVVILVTGDGDFVPLVEYLKWGMGKQVEVCAFGNATASDLRESTDKFVEITDLDNILMDIPKSKQGKKKN